MAVIVDLFIAKRDTQPKHQLKTHLIQQDLLPPSSAFRYLTADFMPEDLLFFFF